MVPVSIGLGLVRDFILKLGTRLVRVVDLVDSLLAARREGLELPSSDHRFIPQLFAS